MPAFLRAISSSGSLLNMLVKWMFLILKPLDMFSLSACVSRLRRMAIQATARSSGSMPNSPLRALAVRNPMTVLPEPVGDSTITLLNGGLLAPLRLMYLPVNMSRACRTILRW